MGYREQTRNAQFMFSFFHIATAGNQIKEKKQVEKNAAD